MRYALLFVVCLMFSAATSQARTLEPGSIWFNGGVGPGFRVGSPLGGSDTYLMLNAQGEYLLSSALGATGEVSLGLAETNPFKIRLGASYHFSGLELPILPYAFGQLSVGRLLDVLGADLTTLGGRVGGGADYFLTARFKVGALFGWELATTLGDRPVTYSQIELLATGSVGF